MLECTFWDVQHGSAAFISTPNQQCIAVDLGSGSYGEGETFSPLLYLRNVREVKKLDAVIFSHPHTDHISDIANFDSMCPAVICAPRHLKESEIRDGNPEGDETVIDQYLGIVSKYSHTVPREQTALSGQNNGGAEIEIFKPVSCPTDNLNNHSTVVLVSYDGSKILIPGDNEEKSWDELFEQDDFAAAIKGTDILVASHHGRKSGFYEPLFDHISPKLTVISDGRHCDTSATDRYASRSTGWQVFHSDGSKEKRHCLTTRNDGAITIRIGRDISNQRYINVTIK